MSRYWALFSLLFLFIFASLAPTVGLADELFPTFRTNPPNNQSDYYSGEAKDRKRIAVVEQYHWHQVETCIQDRNYGCAIRNLAFMLRWVPNHPRALIKLSQISVEVGYPKAVLQYLDYALKYGAQPSTYIAYGNHLYRVGEYREAVEKYKAAISMNPQNSEAYYNLGLTFLALGNYDEARRHARKSYELNYPLPGLKRKLQELGEWNEK